MTLESEGTSFNVLHLYLPNHFSLRFLGHFFPQVIGPFHMPTISERRRWHSYEKRGAKLIMGQFICKSHVHFVAKRLISCKILRYFLLFQELLRKPKINPHETAHEKSATFALTASLFLKLNYFFLFHLLADQSSHFKVFFPHISLRSFFWLVLEWSCTHTQYQHDVFTTENPFDSLSRILGGFSWEFHLHK